MADITLGRRIGSGAEASLFANAIEWVLTHKAAVALVSIMAIAAVLRFLALGDKALHHDESLHAQFTWYIYNGNGYKHDPLMHGPFLFEAGAVVYFLFGDSDMTARVLQAAFGTALVGMPWLLRKQIGMTAVLIAAVLITVSPTLLYVSRFDRHDIYITFWTLSMVICIWRYLDEQRPVFLYAFALVLGLSFATMELTFITAAILLLFLDLMLAVELAKRPGENASALTIAGRALAIAPIAWILCAAWPLLGKQPFGHERMPPVGNLLLVLGTLSLPQFSAGIQQLPFVGDEGYAVKQEEPLRNATVAILIIMSAYAGLVWKFKTWAICAALFYVPYVLMYTSFQPWHLDGFWSGIWGSLDYWLDQHHVKRGDQPIYYYGIMSPLYEFLPLLITLAGGWWLAFRGDSLKRWSLFWLAGMFVGLSIAGEKMPWLEVHIALPLTICAAMILAALVQNLDVLKEWKTALYASLATAAAVVLLVEGDGVLRWLGVLLFAAIVGWVLAFSPFLARPAKPEPAAEPPPPLPTTRRRRTAATTYALEVPSEPPAKPISATWQPFLRAGVVVAFAALFTLTVRAGLTVSFKNSDVPVEMLVYTQTSPDITALRDRIDGLAKATKLGYNLPIVVDPEEGYAWPWAWYLRNYKNVVYAAPDAPGYRGEDGAVLLIYQPHAVSVDSSGYSQTPYKHRWWFNEDYRDLTPGKVLSILSSPSDLKKLGDFFLHRRPTEGHTGSIDGVAFFPESLSAFDPASQATRPVAEPVTNIDGRITVGKAGSGRGEMLLPTDVFVDAKGDIWVADSRNNRIQRFDGNGVYQATLSFRKGQPNALQEPWSVAVDPEGNIYIGDTWNHRIQKFKPSMEPLLAWGMPAAGANPTPLELYGPRDIVIMQDGSLWVSDAGHKRLVHYSADGTPIAVVGREGSDAGHFREPVGLARDGLGNLLVADTWNGRVQVLSPEGAPLFSFETGWNSQEVLAKPYLAALADGRILITDPARGELRLYLGNGAPAGVWKPEADSSPTGVAALPDGGFVYTDSRRNQVQIVPAALIPRLFK